MPSWKLRKCSVAPAAFVLLALAVLVLPLRWICALLLSGVFHELCHVAAIRLCGGKVTAVRIGSGGAVIETTPMETWQELLCALAGPVGGMALLCISGWLPRTAICAAFQSAWNLLPVYPLDGGRALRCSAQLLFPTDIALRICNIVQTACVVLLLCVGIYGTFVLKLGLLPIAAAILLLRKIPCKPAHKRLK